MKRKIIIDKLIFWICILDLIFVPYFWKVAVSFSLPIIYIWMLFSSRKILSNKENRLLVFAISLIILSVIISSYYNASVFSLTFSVSIVIIQGLGYYFLFKYCILKYNINILKVLKMFSFFVFFMLMLFFINEEFFFKLIIPWNFRANPQQLEEYYFWKELIGGYRFAFIWQDPNNIGYIMVSTSAYVLFNCKTANKDKIVFFIIALLTILACKSAGAALALILTVYLAINDGLFKVIYRHKKIKRKKLFLFISIVFLILLFLLLSKVFFTKIVDSYIERMKYNSNSQRLNIYKYVLTNFNFSKCALWGYGMPSVKDGVYFSPHSAHFLLILAYGFPVYLIFIFIFFRKNIKKSWLEYIWILGIFLGFTLNILITEAKQLGIMMFLFASYRCSKEKQLII